MSFLGGSFLRWSGSVTDHHNFLLLNQTYVLGNVRSVLFFLSIVLVISVCIAFIFYNRYIYFYLLYLISKRIFHLGVLISRTHTNVYMSFTEWECFCFLHLLNTILGLWIFNAYSRYFVTECEWFRFCHWTGPCVGMFAPWIYFRALIQDFWRTWNWIT